MTHTVSAWASSLYEAAVQALAEFKESGFALTPVGPDTRLKIAVEAPAITHELSVGKLQACWMTAPVNDPASLFEQTGA